MIKEKKCKYCREAFTPYTFLQKNCMNSECVRKWIAETKEKEWLKRKAKAKQDLSTVQDYIKIAQQVFNKYIRLRDKLSTCISCQKIPKKENAGHFWNANNHWNVRFDERNVHLQCEHCNTHLSGNLIEYQRNLIHKIGIENYQQLEIEARKTRKFTIDELKEIIAKYKTAIKNLEVTEK